MFPDNWSAHSHGIDTTLLSDSRLGRKEEAGNSAHSYVTSSITFTRQEWNLSVWPIYVHRQIVSNYFCFFAAEIIFLRIIISHVTFSMRSYFMDQVFLFLSTSYSICN